MTKLTAIALLTAAALMTIPPHPRRRLLLGPVRGRLPRPVSLAPLAMGLVLVITASPAPGLVGTAAAAMLLWRRRTIRRHREHRREGEAMAAALETIVGELRIGAHPLRAFGTAAGEAPGAVGAALSVITARVGLGADVATGLRAVATESAIPSYWERIAVCWLLASDHGLPMATLMRAAQRDILDRQRFGSRVDAGLAGARATSSILAGLPLLGILLGELIGAHPMRLLLGGGSGGWLLVIGAALIGVGMLWSDRIVNRLAR